MLSALNSNRPHQRTHTRVVLALVHFAFQGL